MKLNKRQWEIILMAVESFQEDMELDDYETEEEYDEDYKNSNIIMDKVEKKIKRIKE